MPTHLVPTRSFASQVYRVRSSALRVIPLIVLSTLASLAISSSTLAAQEAGIAVGSKVPSAILETLDGKSVDLASYVGKRPVVMEFWATWCPLCRKLEPQMAALQSRAGDKVTFVSVGVPQNQTPEKQLTYVNEHRLGGVFLFDRNSTAVSALKVPHTSFVVIVDGTGTVAYTGVGPDQDLSAALDKVMLTKGSKRSDRSRQR